MSTSLPSGADIPAAYRRSSSYSRVLSDRSAKRGRPVQSLSCRASLLSSTRSEQARRFRPPESALLMESVPTLAGLPEHEPMLVHVGIRRLRDRWGVSTADASELLLERLLEREPSQLFVPSFTYSFTQTGQFSRATTPAEVGGFSEHIRSTRDPVLRTLDPVFSCIDALDSGFNRGELNEEAFGERSIWHRWDSVDGLIVNIGLEHLVSTQVHYVEHLARVPYRYEKAFAGRVVDDVAGITHSANYRYTVRDLAEDPRMDFPKRRDILESSRVLHAFEWEGVEVTYLRARALRSVLERAFAADPRAILQHRDRRPRGLTDG